MNLVSADTRVAPALHKWLNGGGIFQRSGVRMLLLVPLLWIAFWLAPVAHASRVVILDAGHGGHDRGGMPGQLVPEKQYALDMALRVDAILRRAGVRTVLTRRGDYFVPLGDRTALANRYRNGVFVSFHFNGAANFNASGIETYYASGRESAALASALHRAILGATGAADRRVRSRSFFVLRKTSIPAVLIEGGFLTNRTEARRISSSSYRARMAEAIARVLIARYR